MVALLTAGHIRQREEVVMSSTAKVRFAELIGSARSALGEVASTPAEADSRAVVRAASAASRAAGFIEGVTASDPDAAREMVAEFESLIHEAEAQVTNPEEPETQPG